MKNMRGVSFTLALLAMASMTSGVSLAENAHFVKVSADIDSSDGGLDLSWKEAGVGNNTLINYTAAANSCVIYACINTGGQHPQASNKESKTATPFSQVTCPSDQNGNVVCSVSVGPPASTLSCPDKQGPYLTWVEYKNITITDNTNMVSTGGKTAITGPLSTCLISGSFLAENPDLCQRPTTCP
jgi:hypothetical protein